jgi:hypothetical protein
MPGLNVAGKPVTATAATLDELAHRIRVASQAAREAWSNALGHALDAGDALNEAQSRVSTGWKKWLRKNCFLGTSTAQLYQQLARHRAEIEAEMARVPELSLRAARRLISKPPKKVSKPDKPDLLVAWNRASEEERTAVLSSVSIVDFFRVMPPRWRDLIEARVINLRAETGNPALKITAVLRKALSLVKTAATPGVSSAVAESNRHEAVAALQQLTVLLVRGGFDLNDITVNTTKAAPKSRRRAA